jgi:hypothetical protein
MKRWLLFKDVIIDPDHFNVFYIEHVPSGEYVIFGEDKSQVCWRLASFELEEVCQTVFNDIMRQIQD